MIRDEDERVCVEICVVYVYVNVCRCVHVLKC